MSSTTILRKITSTITVLSANQASLTPALLRTDAGQYKLASIMLQVTSISGTSPSLSCKLQGSTDNVNYDDILSGGFTAATATGRQRIASIDISGYQYLQLVYTFATSGGTPNCTFTALCQLAQL